MMQFCPDSYYLITIKKNSCRITIQKCCKSTETSNFHRHETIHLILTLSRRVFIAFGRKVFGAFRSEYYYYQTSFDRLEIRDKASTSEKIADLKRAGTSNIKFWSATSYLIKNATNFYFSMASYPGDLRFDRFCGGCDFTLY